MTIGVAHGIVPEGIAAMKREFVPRMLFVQFRDLGPENAPLIAPVAYQTYGRRPVVIGESMTRVAESAS